MREVPITLVGDKTSDIIYRAWCRMKGWGPLFKIIGNFKMATAEHQSKPGAFLSAEPL